MRLRGSSVRLIVALLALSVLAPSGVRAHGSGSPTLRGVVEGAGAGLGGYEVALLASFSGPRGHSEVLGRTMSGPDGGFEIAYRLPRWLPPGWQPVLFVEARKGSAMLASAIGQGPVSGPVVVDELTTVATGFAFAQFVEGALVQGNRYGMRNAVHMAANMADPNTGQIGEVLEKSPNGDETEARATFHSLANIVANCVASEAGCQELFAATTPPRGLRPATVLQAVANIAKYPWLNVSTLFDLSVQNAAVYGPALTSVPAAWTLFLKFTGSFSSLQDENNLLNGPGTFAIDRKGFLWVNDNYVPQPPFKRACAGMRLLKFYPWGENFPGSPYFGGGLSGAGWGISIAPNGRIWVGNFGFAGDGCPILRPTVSRCSLPTGPRSGGMASRPARSPGRRARWPIARATSGSPTALPIRSHSIRRGGRAGPSRSPFLRSVRAWPRTPRGRWSNPSASRSIAEAMPG